jgi:opacity protein-like surface antigen
MSRGLRTFGRSALICSTACAAMALERPTLGFQGLASWPTGSERSQFSSDTGYGLGAFADWEMDAGRVLRLGYDALWYPSCRKDRTIPGAAAANVAPGGDRHHRTHSLMAQYLYFPSQDTEGFYWKVGVGAMNQLARVKTDLTFQGPQAQTVGVTTLQETGTRLAALAGVGYEFGKNWGVMAQYSFITVNNHTLGAVQTWLTFRF